MPLNRDSCLSDACEKISKHIGLIVKRMNRMGVIGLHKTKSFLNIASKSFKLCLQNSNNVCYYKQLA